MESNAENRLSNSSKKDPNQLGSNSLLVEDICVFDTLQIQTLLDLFKVIELSHQHTEIVRVCQAILGKSDITFGSRYSVLIRVIKIFSTQLIFLFFCQDG